MKAPKVSVLMPVYNTKEEFLREAVQSILSQTFKDFEFLILNDSPENTRLEMIIRSFKDKRIKYIQNEQNLGISKSRNKLIDLAKGEYLAVMDHDDISLPERFEKQVAYLDEHPDVGVVGTKKRTISGQISSVLTDNHDIKLALMHGCAIAHPSAMIRKSVLVENNIRYEEEFSPAEDYALWCRLIPFTKFHNLDEILFLYRDHAGNTSHKQLEKMKNKSYAIYSFMKIENPALYEEFLYKAKRIRQINFLGLPVLKIVTREMRSTCYLFGVFPVIKCKTTVKIKEASSK